MIREEGDSDSYTELQLFHPINIQKPKNVFLQKRKGFNTIDCPIPVSLAMMELTDNKPGFKEVEWGIFFVQTLIIVSPY